MICPSCRQDLSGFRYLYRFCPLCNGALSGGVAAPAESTGRAIPRDMVRGPAMSEADQETGPSFDIYWKDEAYKAGKSNALEISLVPGAELRDVSVTARLLSLGLVIERESLPYARKNTSLYFYFKPETPGRHIARLAVTCCDGGGNPTVFETEDFAFQVDEEEKEKEGHTTYHIGDIISAGEVSLAVTKATDRRSSRGEEAEMVRLELNYDEAATRKLRKQAAMDRMMAEGRRLFDEGSGLIESSRRPEGRKGADMGEGLGLLDQAKERFLHVRQEDPAHEESARYMERIRDLTAGSAVNERGRAREPGKRFTSCVLRAVRDNRERKVFLFSGETVTVGKAESNDISFPRMEYISGNHAIIKVSAPGGIFIRDVGTDGKGSKNGTFLNAGESAITPQKDYPLRDGTIINLGKSLGLFCRFLRGPVKDSGGDNAVNAIKLKPGNPDIPDEYIILTGEITAGASDSNGVIIKGDAVSDIHMRIIYRDGLYLIEDLHSLNGTFLNGARLNPGAEYALTESGVLTVGDVEIGVEVGCSP